MRIHLFAACLILSIFPAITWGNPGMQCLDLGYLDKKLDGSFMDVLRTRYRSSQIFSVANLRKAVAHPNLSVLDGGTEVQGNPTFLFNRGITLVRKSHQAGVRADLGIGVETWASDDKSDFLLTVDRTFGVMAGNKQGYALLCFQTVDPNHTVTAEEILELRIALFRTLDLIKR